MTLFRYECVSDNDNMHIQLHQIYFFHSFVRSLACFCLFHIRQCPLQFVVHFIQWFKVNTYTHIYLLTNDALTQKVIFLLCVLFSFDLRKWCLIQTYSMYYVVPVRINTQMRIIVLTNSEGEIFKWDTRHSNSIKEQCERERVIVARSYNQISRSLLLSLPFHCLFRTLSPCHWRHTPHTHTSEM